ncbi:RsmF rRNA methyltransferase first C-terminal domain-containing protein [Paenibacillus mendelii]|uniref:RsmF rRNA methyltransferase first C-terminal domain-containing protein n=1 Tax=Paenibacillus mendelii TaxID=206163 RepID=UPI00195637B3
MGITLPQSFTEKMKRLLLGNEYEAFLASYEKPRKYGLRVNGLKLKADAFAALSPMGSRLTPVPWADSAYYYDEADRPGKQRHYHAGLYYIQEPSAMVPAELLDVQPGDRLLDLCAAPGGKSTQLAVRLQGQGVLVANDNARERTKVLAKNIELAGVRNAIVLNEEPASLAKLFSGWFDRILVDAPCSGEGMFRKDESMIAEWERHSVERCSKMQRDILLHAAEMLAPGGTLVYSTCTFSPEENEAQIAALLERCPELEVVPVALAHGWAPGRPEWLATAAMEAAELGQALQGDEPGRGQAGEAASFAGSLHVGLSGGSREASIAGTVRLWPHLTEGEGHYAAVLRKRGASDAETDHADGGGYTGHNAVVTRSDMEAGHGESERGGRERGERERGGSERGKSERGESERSDRERGGSERGGSERGGSERGGSECGGSERGESERGESERGGRERGESERGESERSGRERGERARGQVLRAEQERLGTGRRGQPPLERKAAARGAEAADPVGAWREFAAKQLIGAEQWTGALIAYGSRVYLQPAGVPPLDGLRVVRAGWYLGEAGPHRFEPSQALAMGLRAEEALLSIRFDSEEEATLRYLKGETLSIEASRLVRSMSADSLNEGQEEDERKTARKGSNITKDTFSYARMAIRLDGANTMVTGCLKTSLQLVGGGSDHGETNAAG